MFSRKKSVNKIYAELSITYNGNQKSGFSADVGNGKYAYLNYYLPVVQQIGSLSRQKIYSWGLEEVRSICKKNNIQFCSETSSNRFYIPEMCTNAVERMTKLAGSPTVEQAMGYLNPGGRTLFVLFSNGEAFTLKVDTSAESGLSAENRKPLSRASMQLSRFNSWHLKQFGSYASEEEFCQLDMAATEAPCMFGYIMRTDRLKCSLLQKDFIIPAYCFFSDIFWQNRKLLSNLGLGSLKNRADIATWLVENFSAGLFSFLDHALLKSHLHAEVHQQNLTCLVRGGALVKFQYHDLLDCVWDPLSYVLDLILNKKTALVMEEWLKTIESSLFQAFGAVPSSNADNARALISIGSWWRRWIRSFGQYDRWINFILMKIHGVKMT